VTVDEYTGDPDYQTENDQMQFSFQLLKSFPKTLSGEKGITGLETAIVLIAFVVVSSVFAFAALSTGMFSSDKARETITAGLAQTRASMQLKGSIIGTANAASATGTISNIEFHVSQTAGGADVDLTPGSTTIRYTDENQNKLFSSTAGMTITPVGGSDTDNLLERDELYRIQLINLDTGLHDTDNDTLKSALGIKTTFTLEVVPIKGAVLYLERTTAVSMDIINFLD
jgi:flagellin FlaB